MTTASPGASGASEADYTFERIDAPSPQNSGGRRTTAVAASLGLVGVLAIGGGAFAISQALSGGGDQPADVLPADTIAYARLDIDPGVGQKIAAVRFLDGLDDQTRAILDSTDIRQEFFDQVIAGEPGLSGFDYATDIEPWLGDRLGIGLVPNDGESEPILAIALQVSDHNLADESLNELISSAGEDGTDWFFQGDYVVFSEAEHSADLERRVNAGTLADSADFRADHDALGDHGIASFWADLDAINELITANLTGFDDPYDVYDPYGSTGDLGALFGGLSTGDDVVGRVAAAVRLGDDYIEIHGLAHGQDVGIAGGNSAQLVTQLPDTTAIALGVEHGDQWVESFWNTLSELDPNLTEQARAEAESIGLTLPQDAQTIVGDSLAISIGANIVEGFDYYSEVEPEIALKVSTEDPERVRTILADVLGAPLDGSNGFHFESDATTYTVGGSQSYVSTVAAGGNLGGTSLFQAAVPHADGAAVIGFVDLNAFEAELLSTTSDPNGRAIIQDIGAIGFSASVDGDTSEFTLRIVADQ